MTYPQFFIALFFFSSCGKQSRMQEQFVFTIHPVELEKDSVIEHPNLVHPNIFWLKITNKSRDSIFIHETTLLNDQMTGLSPYLLKMVDFNNRESTIFPYSTLYRTRRIAAFSYDSVLLVTHPYQENLSVLNTFRLEIDSAGIRRFIELEIVSGERSIQSIK